MCLPDGGGAALPGASPGEGDGPNAGPLGGPQPGPGVKGLLQVGSLARRVGAALGLKLGHLKKKDSVHRGKPVTTLWEPRADGEQRLPHLVPKGRVLPAISFSSQERV